MKRSALALLLSTFCLAVSGCKTTRTVEALRPDKTNPERFVCEAAPARAKIPPEYQIDWGTISSAPTVTIATERAKSEFAKFVGVIRTREGLVAGYVLDLEGKHFTCFTNMSWQRDFYAGLPAK